MPVSDRQSNRQPPWEHDSGQDAVSFGTWLRRQREIREIPLREIADVTKISIRYLEALEQDRFEMLPAPVFAKGFLREYSKYVGLDPDEVVNSYLTAAKGSDEEGAEAEELAAQGSSRTSGFPALIIFITLFVVLALVFFLLRMWSSREPQREPPPIAAPVIPPAPTPAVPEEPEEVAPAPPLVVTMDFTEDCWVEAEVDGERRLSELHVQGESMRLEAIGRVELTLGNPAGVRVEVNGEPYSFEFAAGRVARDLVIDLEGATATDDEPGEDGSGQSGAA